MYFFNAIQIVLLYSVLPLLWNLAAAFPQAAGWQGPVKVGLVFLWIAGTFFLIPSAASSLNAIDRELRR